MTRFYNGRTARKHVPDELTSRAYAEAILLFEWMILHLPDTVTQLFLNNREAQIREYAARILVAMRYAYKKGQSSE